MFSFVPPPVSSPPPRVGRLHVLTDTHFQTALSHAALAARAAAGGADTVQVRQKTGSARERFHALVPAVAACRAAGVPCLVDDALDLALAAGADGVHVGQSDLPADVVRAVLARARTPARLVGVTAPTVALARAAEAAGADYVGVGPVFPTTSKANPTPVLGPDGLARIASAVAIPVVAIGGITPERVAACLGAGAWGVAVMTAVTTAADVSAATARFREEVEKAG